MGFPAGGDEVAMAHRREMNVPTSPLYYVLKGLPAGFV
jgi:hypothetical protein